MHKYNKLNKKTKRKDPLSHWLSLTKLWCTSLMKQPHFKRQKIIKINRHIAGVIILEYALLLISCILLALLIAEVVTIGSSPDEHGWIVTKWMKVIKVIAEDM